VIPVAGQEPVEARDITGGVVRQGGAGPAGGMGLDRGVDQVPEVSGLVAAGKRLVATAAMWEGHEWGGYLLAATVALLLPLDLRQAVVDPTWGHVLLVVLVLLVRGWLPDRPRRARPNRR
jgi:Predicted membrane protein (DUF2127)